MTHDDHNPDSSKGQFEPIDVLGKAIFPTAYVRSLEEQIQELKKQVDQKTRLDEAAVKKKEHLELLKAFGEISATTSSRHKPHPPVLSFVQGKLLVRGVSPAEATLSQRVAAANELPALVRRLRSEQEDLEIRLEDAAEILLEFFRLFVVSVPT